MTRADGTDPTAAARQARRRERLQALGDQDQATLRSILAAVLELSRKVDNLAESVDNRDVTPRSVTSRPEGARARARVRGEAPAPTGPGGLYSPVTPSRVTPSLDLTAAVLASLQGHGANSAGAIRDHLGHGGLEVPLGDVTTALVQLLGGHHVIREEGDVKVGKPDTWRAVDGALARLEAVVDQVRVVTPAPEVHVTCQDYQAHQADHAWDPSLGTFVCARCITLDAALEAVTHGGTVNGHT